MPLASAALALTVPPRLQALRDRVQARVAASPTLSAIQTRAQAGTAAMQRFQTAQALAAADTSIHALNEYTPQRYTQAAYQATLASIPKTSTYLKNKAGKKTAMTLEQYTALVVETYHGPGPNHHAPTYDNYKDYAKRLGVTPTREDFGALGDATVRHHPQNFGQLIGSVGIIGAVVGGVISIFVPPVGAAIAAIGAVTRTASGLATPHPSTPTNFEIWHDPIPTTPAPSGGGSSSSGGTGPATGQAEVKKLPWDLIALGGLGLMALK